MKEKILASCKTLSGMFLVSKILEGIITVDDLREHGLSDIKLLQIENQLVLKEEELWKNIEGNIDPMLACEKYLKAFPNGIHAVEVQSRREQFVEMPWFEAKRKDTIEAYNEYAKRYPGKHTDEIEIRLSEIKQLEGEKREDDLWQEISAKGDFEACYQYLQEFPCGKYSKEARNFLQSREVIEMLRQDINAFYPLELQDKVNDGILTWEQVESIFGYERTQAIRNFNNVADLPQGTLPDQLQPNTTEVYFWGTPSSGKTCALGAIISSANRMGILEKLDCGGYNYMVRLSNLFSSSGFCTFPESTTIDTIQEMVLKLTDKKKNRQHKVTLIDLAGELFRSVYFNSHGLFITEQNKEVLDTAMGFLKNKKNRKIHFFVVEYGAHERTWEGLRMGDYLDEMLRFLKENQVFTKSTDGVYVLVTKCDQMPCNSNERPVKAYEYVKEHLPSFWNTLETTCKRAGIADVSTIAFSVGDVFAQKLCLFSNKDTMKVIEKLISKTPAERTGILGKLMQ